MDTLYSALGKFYFIAHNNSPPTFLQVVGWTKGAERPEAKRQYVYVRKVPLVVRHGLGRGHWEFDDNIIKKYAMEITTPIHKSVDGNAIIIGGAHFLRYQGITVPQKTFDIQFSEEEIIEDLIADSTEECKKFTRLLK